MLINIFIIIANIAIIALLPPVLSVLYLIILLIGYILKILIEAIFLPVFGIATAIATLYIYDNGSDQTQIFLQIVVYIGLIIAGITISLKQRKNI